MRQCKYFILWKLSIIWSHGPTDCRHIWYHDDTDCIENNRIIDLQFSMVSTTTCRMQPQISPEFNVTSHVTKTWLWYSSAWYRRRFHFTKSILVIYEDRLSLGRTVSGLWENKHQEKIRAFHLVFVALLLAICRPSHYRLFLQSYCNSNQQAVLPNLVNSQKIDNKRMQPSCPTIMMNQEHVLASASVALSNG